jgi:hypothetical protein
MKPTFKAKRRNNSISLMPQLPTSLGRHRALSTTQARLLP